MELLTDQAGYSAAFGAEDISSAGMKRAVGEWFRLYYDREDLMQLPYTIVRKLVRSVFAEHRLEGLEDWPGSAALELALIGGESFLKPVQVADRWQWRPIPRGSILVFGRDWFGEPTDVGLMEKTLRGRFYYTLLERRRLDGDGLLTVTNRLFRSGKRNELGREVRLAEQPLYQGLPQRFTYPLPMGNVGLVRLRLPIANCVDGSREGVSIYAAALPLLRAIGENERQLQGEFRRGQSRLVVSRDMLRGGQLQDELFVALDESPENTGITVFAPPLREESYLARQQAYLRSLEHVIGLKRGLLSQVEAEDRTATEITSSEGEYMTLILDLRKAVDEAAQKCAALLDGLDGGSRTVAISWGDNVV